MQGRIPDIFLYLVFQKDRLKMLEQWGGRIFGFPIDLAHRLYNSLLLSHKLWILQKDERIIAAAQFEIKMFVFFSLPA